MKNTSKANFFFCALVAVAIVATVGQALAQAALILMSGSALQNANASGDTPASRGSVYVSRDHGITWNRGDTGFPEDDGINALILYNDRVLAGTGSHGIWATGREGWYSQSKGLPHSSRVLSLVANDRMVFAGLYNHGLYYSADEGTSWHAAGYHPNTNVRALGTHAGRLYVGTDDGIYTLNMADLSWKPVLNGVQINAFESGAKYLYAATHKGVVRSQDGLTWTPVYEEGAIAKVAISNNELRLMDHSGHVYRAQEISPYFIAEDLLLPHFNFRLTPASPRIIGGDWSNLSFIKNGSRLGLPDNVPLSILLQTPFGLMATRPPLSGC